MRSEAATTDPVPPAPVRPPLAIDAPAAADLIDEPVDDLDEPAWVTDDTVVAPPTIAPRAAFGAGDAGTPPADADGAPEPGGPQRPADTTTAEPPPEEPDPSHEDGSTAAPADRSAEGEETTEATAALGPAEVGDTTPVDPEEPTSLGQGALDLGEPAIVDLAPPASADPEPPDLVVDAPQQPAAAAAGPDLGRGPSEPSAPASGAPPTAETGPATGDRHGLGDVAAYLARDPRSIESPSPVGADRADAAPPVAEVTPPSDGAGGDPPGWITDDPDVFFDPERDPHGLADHAPDPEEPELPADDDPAPHDPGLAEVLADEHDLVDPHELDDHHEYEELRHGHRGGRRVLAILAVIVLLLAAVGGGIFWWYQRQVDPPGPPGEKVAITIPTGSSTSRIGDILHGRGVIANSTVWDFYVGRKGAGPFQAGAYTFQENSDLDLVISVLDKGPSTPEVTKVSLPEGLTVAQIVAKISAAVPRFTKADLEAALKSSEVTSPIRPAGQTSWEGLLYPATYDVGEKTDVTEFLADLASRSTEQVQAAVTADKLAAIKERYGVTLTPYQAVVVASLIQREAGNEEEAPKIATVIYNRLQQGIPLGIDATSRYLAESTGTKLDFSSDSPYNTRRQKGLPPTPIATPSSWALDAAVAPADGPWLYYVLTEPGKHSFVTTNDEFLAAKQVCKEKGLGCG